MAQATARSSSRFDTASIPTLGWLALALVVATGVLHVYAGVIEGRIPVLLAGVGFLGATVLYLADYRRRLLVLLAIPYTAIQIPLWYVANAPDFALVGYLDKAVQVVLVLVLIVLYRQGE
jgi:hypothetical protein